LRVGQFVSYVVFSKVETLYDSLGEGI
jgi:hypothetical protein